jgi:hypothetical protein
MPLIVEDFRPGETAVGPQGPAGFQGPAGPQGPVGPQGEATYGTITAQPVTLTSTHIFEKKVALDNIPAGGILWLHPHGGIPQRQGVDYSLSGGFLVWDSLGLDGVLSVDEKIELFYFINS